MSNQVGYVGFRSKFVCYELKLQHFFFNCHNEVYLNPEKIDMNSYAVISSQTLLKVCVLVLCRGYMA